MNTAGKLVLMVLAILISIALLTLTIVFSVVPKTTTIPPTQPIQNTIFAIPSGINQSYFNTPSGTFQLAQSKPFVVNSRRDGPTKNSFLFSKMPFAKITTPASIGFTFYVYQEQVVVSLQCVDQYFLLGERQVGIFEVGRRMELVNATVSKTTDALVQGLRTHAMLYQEQIHLFPGILYACVAQVFPGDYRSLDNTNSALFTNDVSFVGTCSIASTVLTLPNSFPSNPYQTSPFPGFQLRAATPVKVIPTFLVDTQSASMPLNYIADLNLEITSTSLRLLPGACASQNGVYNVDIFEPQFLSNFAGVTFQPSTWYAVYATNKPEQPILISPNFPEPKLTQSEIETMFFRRVGFAQTMADPTQFVACVQSGPETRRTMTFTNPEYFAQSLELKDGAVFPLPLDMVAPTANSCTLEVELFFDNPTDPTPAITLTFGSFHQIITFKNNQSYQIVQLLLQLSEVFIPRATTLSCQFNTPYSGPSIPNARFTVLDYSEDI